MVNFHLPDLRALCMSRPSRNRCTTPTPRGAGSRRAGLSNSPRRGHPALRRRLRRAVHQPPPHHPV
ncbi:hypothetical protein HBB16_04755 [Pseudonocardia sp. MCCB 268]|nr:hypothetical protein [Pseudonocardia cytotoxica]